MSVKTFDLVPIIAQLDNSDASRHLINQQIKSLDSSGRQIFVGTHLGLVARYDVFEVRASEERAYNAKFYASKNIGTRKPVDSVKAIGKLNRVLYLSDNVLAMLDASTVEIVPTSGSKIKNVTMFSLNDRIDMENPFITFELCVARKKTIHIYTVQETHFTPVIDIQLADVPVRLIFSDPFVCFASSLQYHIINVKQEQTAVADLFPYSGQPAIVSLPDSEQHEFLLSGPGGLGMFVSAQSLVAPRPPISWAEISVVQLQYSAPNTLVYTASDVWVFSSINQQPKQSLQFENCRACCSWNPGGHSRSIPLMASASQIWAMEDVPWQEQVELLLADWRADEAVQIARSFVPQEEDGSTVMKNVLFRAALIAIQKDDLDKAQELLLESQSDPSDILCYCPDLCAQVSGGGDANILLFSSEEDKVRRKRNRFLVEYLEKVQKQDGSQPALNMVLLKLFCLLRDDRLLPFVKSYRNPLPVDEAAKFLEQSSRHLALSYLLMRRGAPEAALGTLISLLDGKIVDEVDGTADVLVAAEVLKSVDGLDAFIEFLPWFLKRDEAIAVDILRNRQDSEGFERILEVIDGHADVKLDYLEHLTIESHIRDPHVCTALIMEYLARLRSGTDMFDNEETQRKLSDAIRLDLPFDASSLYPVLDELQLHSVKVTVLAKEGRHIEALDILTGVLGDRDQAVQYCSFYGATDPGLRRSLFEHVLSRYFKPTATSNASMNDALEVLNHELADFDPLKVLAMLPVNLSILNLKGFLMNALRRNLHDQRMHAVETQLNKVAYLLHAGAFEDVSRTKVSISESRSCSVCRRTFIDCGFVRQPSGAVCHIECHKQKSNDFQ